MEKKVKFFFSSRRRHTRYIDWSSDVCSSDLSGPIAQVTAGSRWPDRWTGGVSAARSHNLTDRPLTDIAKRPSRPIEHAATRSEERRVGKEGRCRRDKQQQEQHGHHVAIQVSS